MAALCPDKANIFVPAKHRLTTPSDHRCPREAILENRRAPPQPFPFSPPPSNIHQLVMLLQNHYGCGSFLLKELSDFLHFLSASLCFTCFAVEPAVPPFHWVLGSWHLLETFSGCEMKGISVEILSLKMRLICCPLLPSALRICDASLLDR
ncbi:hypothetical protein Anapl_14114 [Anas platyrhynchos]|uniref:Uncharacterized protein n=1 Tax=Anas platyrhynchos TaxID=8839 RepID=R0LI21_ANAPL|nr:hypothetical protein Anapl_14114 [Anas platyrhynchos]